MLAERLAKSGYHMVGVDPSQGMLDILEARTQLVRPVCASGTALPFDDDSFELVITVAAMHHIADPGDVRQTLAEMVRVVKPSGRLVVWDHNPRNPYWKALMAVFPRTPGGAPDRRSRDRQRSARCGRPDPAQQTTRGRPGLHAALAIPVAAALERAVERTPGLRSLAAHNVIVATK